MMAKHPEWFAKNRSIISRLALDYSNPNNWTGNLQLENVDIVTQWELGRGKAEMVLKKCSSYRGRVSDFGSLSTKGHTMLIPYGNRKIGVQALQEEEEEEEEEQTSHMEDQTTIADQEMEIEDTPLTSIINVVEQSGCYDPQIEMEGNHVYKATIVKSLFRYTHHIYNI